VLAKYAILLFPRIKVEFCPQGTNFALPLPNSDIYMHPQILALWLKLPLTKFIRDILSHFISPLRTY